MVYVQDERSGVQASHVLLPALQNLSLARCCNDVGVNWMHADCYKDKNGILTMGKQSRPSFQIAQNYSCQISDQANVQCLYCKLRA